MKKHFATGLLAFFLMGAFILANISAPVYASSDNGTDDASVESEDVPDLTGDWVEKDAENIDTYQKGYIKDGVIELFWILNDGTSSLYWSGSYEAPEGNTDNYSWESVNDKTKTEYALMAANDDSKTFNYKDGEISYEASAMGMTKTVELIRADDNYEEMPPQNVAFGTVTDGKPLELVVGNYSWFKRDDSAAVNLYYSMQIHNPNEKYAVEFPRIQVTARAADKSILTTNEQVICPIAAGDTIMYAGNIQYEGEGPEVVDIVVTNDKDHYLNQEGSGVIRQDMLTISNLSEVQSSFGPKYTGELKNNSTMDIGTVCMSIVFKNGDDNIGGISTYLQDLPSGATKPFELEPPRDILEYDSYEIYALKWN